MAILNLKNFLNKKSWMNYSSSSRGSPSSFIRHLSFLSFENYHSKSSFSKTMQIKLRAVSWSPWNPTLCNNLNLLASTFECPKVAGTFFESVFITAIESYFFRKLYGLVNLRFGFANLYCSACIFLICSSLKYFLPPLSGLRLDCPKPEF
jgi:hypothetical protein